MRILVLSKRQYTNKDLLDDRYGRLFELPAALAAAGHEVRGVALSYRHCPDGWYTWDAHPRLSWYAITALPWGLFSYATRLLQIAGGFKPDLIWACSDAPHAVIGWWLKHKIHRPLVIDLYDNFESFGLTRMPGMTFLLRAACRHADALSVVSRTLDEYLVANYGVTAPRAVIGNGISEDMFFQRNRRNAREALRLPKVARLIGTAGAINASRGIADLFEAFLHLAARDENLWLVYAGPRDSTPRRYPHERIIDLGILPQDKVALLFSALDVAVICNRDSDFGRFCFPQKLNEIIACGTPFVAASVGDVALKLGQQHEYLYPPGDWITLAEKIAHHLDQQSKITIKAATWKDCAVQLEAFFQEHF